MTVKNANISHVWSVLCQSSTVDEATNDLSLHKTIDEMAVTFENADALQAFVKAASEKPVAGALACELVTLWKKIDRAQSGDFDVQVAYRDPDGKELLSMDIPISMEGSTFRHRNRLSIPAVPITVPGEYAFVVKAKAKEATTYHLVTEIPLDISFKLDTAHK